MNTTHREIIRLLVAVPLGLVVARVGLDHFLRPEIFDAIVPSYLGWPRFWTLASGALEVLLGLGLVLPKTRALSARCFALLVLLMSLANLNMWWNDLEFNGTRLSATGHLLRMSAQIILLLTLYWLSKPAQEKP
jgi:uncharacterized membrane protein